MTAPMSPAALADPPALIEHHPEKLSAAEVARIIQEPNGASALIVLLRNNRVDVEMVIDAITKLQNTPTSRIKRMLVALVDTILPG